MEPNQTPLQPYQPPAPNAPEQVMPTPAAPPAPAGMVKPTPPPKKASTQSSLLVAEVRDGIVIMRDGSLRAVILCQSINFDLMSPQEREAVEYSYQGFLNSLYFPIQIFIRSLKVDLEGYIERLNRIKTSQENVLLSLLMEDYVAYVKYLVEAANIMDKQFYIVVPYFPSLLSQEGLATGAKKVGGLFKKQQTVVLNETDFARYKTELAQRVQIVLSGLQQFGIRAVALNTQELIELYYNFYNAETAPQQNLTDIGQLEASVITKGEVPPTGGNDGTF